MSNPKQQRANRVNAQASTGQKTAQGKARASQNARRHGLSLSVISDPALSKQVESLARRIAGPSADDETYEVSRRIAGAQIDLARIRQARHDLLARNISDPDYGKAEALIFNAKLVNKVRHHLGVDSPILQWLENIVRTPPQGPHKVVAILSDLSKQLVLLDRYERRALSRRKFAIREFDAARKSLEVR